jgi:hypothetical protein
MLQKLFIVAGLQLKYCHFLTRAPDESVETALKCRSVVLVLDFITFTYLRRQNFRRQATTTCGGII